MFIFAIIGFIALFWFVLEGLWKLIPWLILSVIVTSIINMFLEHMVWVIAIIGALVFFYIVGTRADKKEQESKTLDGQFEEVNK